MLKIPFNNFKTLKIIFSSLPVSNKFMIYNNFKKFNNYQNYFTMESDPKTESAKKEEVEKTSNIPTEDMNLKRKSNPLETSTEKKKRAKKKILHFVTGNENKFKEAAEILKAELPDVDIRQVNADVPELQGEPEDIVRGKLRYALEKHKGPIVVDDTSLCFNALHGLPGPYIKSFLIKLGREGLYDLIKHYDDQTAYAQCIFGMTKRKTEDPKIFIGRTEGTIVMPRGDTNFGWDPIFLPKGFDQTYAEMDASVKNSISHRKKALTELANWLKENPEYF